jgi:hypothetical protein
MSSIATRKMLAITLYTGSARSLTLDTYPGDVTIGGMKAGDTDESPILDRGQFAGLTEGDDIFPSLALSLYHDGNLTDAATSKIGDFLRKTGACASDSTCDPEGRVWSLKVVATVTYPGGTYTQTFTMPNVRFAFDYATAKEANTLSLTGTCYHGAAHIAPVTIT